MHKKHPLAYILRLRSTKKIDQAFDMLIFYVYNCGQFDQNIPVNESREAFEHIKKLLTNPHSKRNNK